VPLINRFVGIWLSDTVGRLTLGSEVVMKAISTAAAATIGVTITITQLRSDSFAISPLSPG
jgi:hypothetical protein